MRVTIKSEELTITIDSIGAEIVSIQNTKGHEFLWQGSIWPKHSPILFPWAGRFRNEHYFYNKKEYSAPVHGFLQKIEHKIISRDSNSIVFAADCDEKDLYPFKFTFEQYFVVEGNKITHSVKVINTDSQTMFFGLGFHPAFNCPFSKDKKAEDYSIVFEEIESPEMLLMDEGLPNHKKERYFENKNNIILSDTLFMNDTLCFENLKSKKVTLQEKDSDSKITVTFEDIPYLLFWSPATPTLEFLCIEPWMTIPDYSDASLELTEKKQLLQLEKGKTFNSKYTMEIAI